jgi:DNA processing protein
MNIKKLTLKSADYPEPLRQLHKPPQSVYATGATLNDLVSRPSVAIVGTRRMTLYGKQVTRDIAMKLAEQGVVIISGLAFGVDALAHRAALDAGGTAIAVLPSPLDNILPVANRRLAENIIAGGGALVSEYPPGEIPFKQNFIARNRIVSGLAKVVLIIEAGEKSGALYTARFANEQNRELFAVPGSISSPYSVGTNNLIKNQSAAAATSYKDILVSLGIYAHTLKPRDIKGRNRHEQVILDLILKGVADGDDLLEKSNLDITEFNQTMTMLEISSKIRALGGNNWSIY